MMVATKIRAPLTRRRSPKSPLAPTLGRWVCDWIEEYLFHGEGDYLGQSFRLRDWQRRLIYRAYELNADGTRRYKRILWGLPKGNGKTELAAGVALAELMGPVHFAGWREDGQPVGVARTSPDIPIAAASFDQADLLFGAACTMLRAGPLKDYCEVYDTEILVKGRAGVLYRVAAAAGTNDGGRPTCFISDELHEWEGRKERVHIVLSNGRAKRRDSWELAISTAGWNMQSLLGRLYAHGCRVRAGEVVDPELCFEWFEAPKDLDLADPAQLEQAVRIANPAAGDFLPIENVRARYREVSEFEFRRYYLNQWVSAPERWLPAGAWEACERSYAPPDRTNIALGFDGSYARDSTALVGCTLEGHHVFVVDAWERPEGTDEWRVPIETVEEAIRAACRRWQVASVACDPPLWQATIQKLQAEKLPMVEWPSHSAQRMVPACAQFYDAVRDGRLTHDGDDRLARHIANCVVKIDGRGPRITKDHKDSGRHIDLAVAAVISYDMALRRPLGTGWRPL